MCATWLNVAHMTQSCGIWVGIMACCHQTVLQACVCMRVRVCACVCVYVCAAPKSTNTRTRTRTRTRTTHPEMTHSSMCVKRPMHSYVWRCIRLRFDNGIIPQMKHSVTCDTWLIHVWHMTHSFIRMTWLIHSYVWHDSFTHIHLCFDHHFSSKRPNDSSARHA